MESILAFYNAIDPTTSHQIDSALAKDHTFWNM